MIDPDLKKAIEDTIDTKINGKLDKVVDIVEKHVEVVEKYRAEHQEHMKEIQPILDGFKAVSIGRKGIIWMTSLVAAVGGAILIIKRLFY